MQHSYPATRGARGSLLPAPTAPAYDEPPFQYRNIWFVNIPFQTRPDVIDRLVPAPLRTDGDGSMLLSINYLEADGLGQYHEVVLSVPCHFDLPAPDPFGVPARPRAWLAGEYAAYHPAFGCVSTTQPGQRSVLGQYIVHMYVDKDTAIAAGREVWGFPKKGAEIVVERQSGVIAARIEREGSTLIQATFTLAEAGTLVQLFNANWKPDTWFNLKVIPSVQGGMDSPDVAQLTCTTLENLNVTQLYQGQGQVTLGGSSTDPLHTIPVLQVAPGFYVQGDFDLPYGRVLHDYLAR